MPCECKSFKSLIKPLTYIIEFPNLKRFTYKSDFGESIEILNIKESKYLEYIEIPEIYDLSNAFHDVCAYPLKILRIEALYNIPCLFNVEIFLIEHIQIQRIMIGERNCQALVHFLNCLIQKT